ncbi:MAG: phosphoadenosine phosphosulfate reductase [Bacteroidetes bacterium GWE2_29_8]|nr:MAG: phosphoadenosine phosphosulfate reductase [Bacteroidetes bacterium GWE2_29_8]OFY16613.1 MAG: phosphoadenosine phosphosulfate reductase [Bacteroidetes bacterium GWF2_29_10]
MQNKDIQNNLNDLNELFNKLTSLEIIQKSNELFETDVVFLTSMGLEDMVILDMIVKSKSDIKIFTIDTGRLYNETYSLISKTEQKYNTKINIVFPNNSEVEEMVNNNSINLFYESINKRKLCCEIRKIKPLKRVLSDSKAWICGLRKTQSITRHDLKIAEHDVLNNLIKINPLLDWTEEMVWNYIKENNVPYNILHDKGFPSIGCAPCTRAIKKDEDIRAGRWWWESPENKECGLHK